MLREEGGERAEGRACGLRSLSLLPFCFSFVAAMPHSIATVAVCLPVAVAPPSCAIAVVGSFPNQISDIENEEENKCFLRLSSSAYTQWENDILNKTHH